MQDSFGQYKLLSRVAQGGMGEVFRAKLVREGGFEKIVAVKRMLPQLIDTEGFEDRFCTEAKLSAKLNHANIAQIYDFGRIQDSLFISMEYVEGVDLGVLLARATELGQQISVISALQIVADALKGLDYAHRLKDEETGRELNLIHCDISPSNILLSFEGEVKLTDFGLASAKDELDTDKLVGKYSYMSPEQVTGEPLDRRSDVYSVGLVLYELLYSKKAFSSDIPAEALLKSIAFGAIDFPEDSRITTSLLAILKRSTAKEKSNRFNTAREMLLAIKEVQEQIKTLQVETSDNKTSNDKTLSKTLGQMFPDKAAKRIVTEERTIMSSRPIVKKPVVAETSKAINVENGEENLVDNLAKSGSLKKYLWLILFGIFISSASFFAYNYLNNHGSLLIKSSPSGAKIWLNETDSGFVTPKKLTNLKAEQQYEIKLSLLYYQKASEFIEIQQGKIANLDFKLLRSVQQSLLNTEPNGAKAYLNGVELKGLTPLDMGSLPLGIKHQLKIEKSGFIPIQTEFIIQNTQSEPKEFNYKLVSFYKEIKIITTPKDAKLYLEGSLQKGNSPHIIKDLIPNREINIVATMKGYLTKSQTIVPTDLSEPLNFSLSPFTSDLEITPKNSLQVRVDGKIQSKRARVKKAHLKPHLLSFKVKKPPGSKSFEQKLSIRITVSQIKNSDGRYITQAILNFAAKPWAKIKLDRKTPFTTPSSNIKLYSGRHKIKFSFGDEPQQYEVYLSLK